ncbi:hypothetical protein L6452_02576 [Arctium lappa]|uniref:Uncharacterized protein n=1 Tax=Arctium lappa TaxID=4217 RepID=A0ACB9FJZ6_ARCLA|nr:hypothetical protein L6452_02576 [Arctium lappa]
MPFHFSMSYWHGGGGPVGSIVEGLSKLGGHRIEVGFLLVGRPKCDFHQLSKKELKVSTVGSVVTAASSVSTAG